MALRGVDHGVRTGANVQRTAPQITIAESRLQAKSSSSGVARLRNEPAPTPKTPGSVKLHTSKLPGTRLVVDENTRLSDVARTFGKLDGKRLRMGLDKEGNTILYTRSALFRGKAQLSSKHTEATAFVKGLVDREIGPGAGERLLSNGGLPAGHGLRDLARQAGRQAERIGYNPAAQPAANAAFRDGRTHLAEANRVSISDSGAGGVVLARHQGPDGTVTGVAALKIEHPVRLAGAEFVSVLADKVASHANRPLPFAMPRHERIGQPTQEDVAHLRDTLQNVRNDPATDADKTRKIDQSLKLLEAERPEVSKYEFLNGHDLNRVPLAQRQELYASGKIGADLGHSALIANALGLSDHLGLSSDNSSVNMSNFFVTGEGRLTAMDLAAFNQNNPPNPLGLNDQQLLATVTRTVNYLEELANSTEPRDRLLDKVIADAGGAQGSPFAGIVSATVHDRHPDALFNEGEPATSRADNRNHVAHLLSGAAESVAYLRDNAAAFARAHQELHDVVAQNPELRGTAIRNPEQTFAQVRELTARIDDIESKLNQKLGL